MTRLPVRPASLILLLTAAAALSGCGYRNISRPPEEVSVYFPLMVNESAEPEAEILLGNAVSERLARSGITPGTEGRAHYRLEGRVVEYELVGAASRDGSSMTRLVAGIEVRLLPEKRELPGADFRGPAFFREEHRFFREGAFAQEPGEAGAVVARELSRKVTRWLLEEALPR